MQLENLELLISLQFNKTKNIQKSTFSFQDEVLSQQADDSNHGAKGGKLTERLLDQGLLTKKMVNELQREWKNNALEEFKKDS